MTTTPPQQPTPMPGPITRTAALASLQRLYDQLPGMACKGLCHDSCTVVTGSQLERDQVTAAGFTLTDESPRAVMDRAERNGGVIGDKCPALSVFGKCRVYQVRPFICRVFGAVSHTGVEGPARFAQPMMCDHGCEPEFTLSMEEFMDLLCRIELLSRLATGVARAPLPGDSPRLRRQFGRDHLTGRAGFAVDPHHPNRLRDEETPDNARARIPQWAAAAIETATADGVEPGAIHPSLPHPLAITGDQARTLIVADHQTAARRAGRPPGERPG